MKRLGEMARCRPGKFGLEEPEYSLEQSGKATQDGDAVSEDDDLDLDALEKIAFADGASASDDFSDFDWDEAESGCSSGMDAAERTAQTTNAQQLAHSLPFAPPAPR